VPIVVQGIDALKRSFATLDRNLGKGISEALENAAEPVRTDAQSLALGRIRRMSRSPQWATMRVGTTRDTIVYLAPGRKGVNTIGGGRRKRPNLAGLLLHRAMEPAVEQNAPNVEAQILNELDELFRAWGRLG